VDGQSVGQAKNKQERNSRAERVYVWGNGIGVLRTFPMLSAE
jgi:hypothetical protein